MIWDGNARKYTYLHRMVMEQELGRRLRKDEVVHHINGKRNDNRPENLEVLRKHVHDKMDKKHTPKRILCCHCGKHSWLNDRVYYGGVGKTEENDRWT